MAAQGQMSPEQVKSICKSLEVSPSKSQPSSHIAGSGKTVGKGKVISPKKKGIA